MTTAYTSVPGVTTRLVVVRCKYCDKPFATVSSGAVIEFKCSDRGCKFSQRQQV